MNYSEKGRQIPDNTVSPPVKYHGLLNQGATCYLNSVLQVLFMSKDFRAAVERHTRGNPNTECIDRHLTALFDVLKEDKAVTKKVTKKLGIDKVNEQRDAAEYFEKILSLTSPEASQIFHGLLTQKTICSTCSTETDEDGAFWHLPLALVDSHSEDYSVVDGIKDYFRVSDFSGENQMYCDQCDAKSDATTKCVIKHHPEVLMLLLKRIEFDYHYMTYVKINCSVVVPRTLQIPENQTYELYAVVDHFGDLKRGHYTATIKSKDDERWYNFHDDRVTLLDYHPFQVDNFEKSRSAYLLFYRKKDVYAADRCTQHRREVSTPGDMMSDAQQRIKNRRSYTNNLDRDARYQDSEGLDNVRQDLRGHKPVSVDKQGGEERTERDVKVDKKRKTRADERGTASERKRLTLTSGGDGDSEQKMAKDHQRSKQGSSKKYTGCEQQSEERRDVMGVHEQKRQGRETSMTKPYHDQCVEELHSTSLNHGKQSRRQGDPEQKITPGDQEKKGDRHIQNRVHSSFRQPGRSERRRMTENQGVGSVQMMRRANSLPNTRQRRTSQDGERWVENNHGNGQRKPDPRTAAKDTESPLSEQQKCRRVNGNTQGQNDTNSTIHSNASRSCVPGMELEPAPNENAMGKKKTHEEKRRWWHRLVPKKQHGKKKKNQNNPFRCLFPFQDRFQNSD